MRRSKKTGLPSANKMNQSKSMRFKPILALCCASVLAATSAHADRYWNPAHILSVLRNPNTTIPNMRLSVVIAHRGVVSDHCPENSLCSIRATFDSDVEGIELDVKESHNKTLWLSHDQRIGRETYGRDEFNIFTTNYNVPNNPDISLVDDGELQNLLLRDRTFATTPGYTTRTLEEALTFIRDTVPHMVVVLDLKTSSAVSSAADIVNRLGMASYVVLKTSATTFGKPNQISAVTKGVPFAPTIYSADMTQIINSGWDGGCSAHGGSGSAINQCRVESWVLAAKQVSGYSWVEIGNKDAAAGDPTFFLLQWASSNNFAMGGFQPVPEYPNHDGFGASYVRSNATCCAKLTDYLTPKSAYFPAETQDNRPYLTDLINSGFSSYITDDAATAVNTLNKDGKRNPQSYQ